MHIRSTGREPTWILALAFSIVILLLTWVLMPSILNGNPLAGVLLGVVEVAGSLAGAMAGLVALKRFLGRPRTHNPMPHPGPTHMPRTGDPYRVYRPSGAPNPLPPSPRSWSLELLKSLEWKRFEELCDAYSRTKGMRTELTRLGPDGGVDIRLYRADGSVLGIVQCKAWADRYVGVRYLRELAGVMASERVQYGVFITSSRFTPDATAFAEKNRIVLLDGRGFLDAIQALPQAEQDHLLALATEGDYTTPTCPRCGIKMVRRQGRTPFWGCRNYPSCRATLRIGRRPYP